MTGGKKTDDKNITEGRERSGTCTASAAAVCGAQALACSQLIFIGKARSTKCLRGLYITSGVFLTDKPSLTSLLTRTLNYCLCLLWQPRFPSVLFFSLFFLTAVLFPFSLLPHERWMTGAPMTNVGGVTSLPGLLSHWLAAYECLMRPVWLDPGYVFFTTPSPPPPPPLRVWRAAWRGTKSAV